MKSLHRERTLLFEKELQGRLDDLVSVEKEILLIESQRRRWVDRLAHSDSYNSDIFFKKMEVLKAQSELSSLNMTLDVLKLEAHSEAQTLNYLIAATKPYEEGEQPQEREVQLSTLARNDSEAMRHFLEQSYQYRSKLCKFNYDLNSELSRTQVEFDNDQRQYIENTKDRLKLLMERMRTSLHQSKKTYQKITGEYLIVRHNAKMAKEMLSRSQADATNTRLQLQNSLEEMTLEAQRHRENLEMSSSFEVQQLSGKLRSEVMKKEAMMEEMEERVKIARRSTKTNCQYLRKKIRNYENKYVELHEKRKDDVQAINTELKKLKDMITLVELKLTYGKASAVGLEEAYEEENALDRSNLPAVLDEFDAQDIANGALLKKLKAKLFELQRINDTYK